MIAKFVGFMGLTSESPNASHCAVRREGFKLLEHRLIRVQSLRSAESAFVSGPLDEERGLSSRLSG